VLPDLGSGGAQRVMLTLARGLDRQRFDLRLIVFGGSKDFASDVPTHATVEELGAERLRRALPMLIRALRRSRPRIVVSVMGYINLALLAARPLLPSGTRIVVREANVVSATNAAFPAWVPTRCCYRTLYPGAAAIIAPRQPIADEIARAAPAAASRIVVLPNPADQAKQRSLATPVQRPPGPGLNIVAAGRLTWQKGFDRLIDLVPQLPNDAQVTIFGEGPDRSALEARARALGVNNRVALPGFSPSLAAAIAGADVFVLPSRWEGLSNVTLEALALGIPVVASDEAGVEEIARAAPQSVTIARLDASFAAAITRYQPASGPTLRPSLLPAEYRAENVAARFNDLLLRVASGP
jgi:glycosyltransferase involved in cell wall biosynthesis